MERVQVHTTYSMQLLTFLVCDADAERGRGRCVNINGI